MDEVMMVPVNEFKQLENYYKGQITESALLNKAGRLAAEQHLILKDKSIPDGIAVRMTKPMAVEQDRLVKRIRTGKRGPPVYQGTEEPEGMADGPTENLLKQIIKGLDRPAAAAAAPPPRIKPEPPSTKKIKMEPATPSTSGVKIKKEFKSKIPTPVIKKEFKSKIPTPISRPTPRPKTSKPSSKSKGAFKSLLRGAKEGALKSLTKGKKPGKRGGAEKLRPSKGWESWYPQGDLRKKLEYDTDSD